MSGVRRVCVVEASLTQTDERRPVLRGWSHLIAAVAAIVVCPLVIVFSPGLRTAVAIYAAAVIGLFLVSGTYHTVLWGTRAEGFARRLDHAMIFVLIAATYTPIAVSSLPRNAATLILVVVWTGAVMGLATQLTRRSLPRRLIVSLYIVVGWAITPVVHLLWGVLGVTGFGLLLIGGVLHTVGAVIYATERPNPYPRWFGFHEIFHLLVIGAVAAHYVVIAFVISPSSA